MIKFSLRCSAGHSFDSWFKSNDAFESLGASGMLSCPVCGSEEIEKNIMTPQVRPSPAKPGADSGGANPADISKPATKAEKMVRDLRRIVNRNFENVGRRFAAEARAMHEGDSPKRSIMGEANFKEAAELLEDGIPVAPLPWPNPGKTN